MPKRDKLFLLVKSLTKSEKRYFSIFTQMHIKGDDNDYMKLFKEFERQEVLNEQIIRENLSDEKLMAHYAVTKSYLYDLILKAMRSYSKHSPDKKVLDLLQDAEFLYSKGIFDQALTLIEKAKEIASENGLLATRDLILHWEKLVHLASGFVHFDFSRHIDIGAEQLQLDENREEQHMLWMLCAGMALKLRRGNTTLGETEKAMQNRMSGEVIPPNDELKNFRSYYLDLYARTLYSCFSEEPHEALNWIDSIISFMEADAQRWTRHPYLYSRVLSDKLLLMLDLGRFNEVPICRGSIAANDQLDNINTYFDAWRSFVLCQSHMLLQWYTNQPSEGAKAQGEVRILSKKYAPFLNPILEMEFNFLLGVFQYQLENWEAADGYFAQIMRDNEEGTPASIISATLIMRFFVMIQLNNPKRIVKMADRIAEHISTSPTPGAQEAAIYPLFLEISKIVAISSTTERVVGMVMQNKALFIPTEIPVGLVRYYNGVMRAVQDGQIWKGMEPS
jgi:tetratricopeptide (TPR) repeat protein